MSDKYPGLYDGPVTVKDYIELLQQFPLDWPVKVKFAGGGGTAIERRDFQGVPHVGIYNKNGGSYNFGERGLTEEEYTKTSQDFLKSRKYMQYTSIHGDHRLYIPGGAQETCYGTHYDRRVIEQMVREGLITADSVDLERVANCDHR